MTQPNFTENTALLLLDSHEPFPVSFDRAWKWLGFSRKDPAKRSLFECGFIEGIDFHISVESDNHTDLSPQEKAVRARKEKIQLTIDCFKTWGMMANTEQGKQVRKYFLQCEKVAKQKAAELLDRDRYQTPQTVRKIWEKAKDYPLDEQEVIKAATRLCFSNFSPFDEDKCHYYIPKTQNTNVPTTY